jgi:hypothetical protein
MKMKSISNIAAIISAIIVVAAFALKMFGVTAIAMSEAVIVGGFIKAVFLPVDASLWIKNSREKTASPLVERDESNA